MTTPYNPNSQPQFGQGQGPQFGQGQGQGPQFHPNQPPQFGPGQGPQFGEPQRVRRGPGWPTWAYLGLTLLTLLGSFLPVLRLSLGWEGLGSVGISYNWWGAVGFEGTGLGAYGSEYLTEELGTMDSGMLVSCIAVLVLYIAATVVGFIGRDKFAAIVGLVAGVAQLIACITNLFQGQDFTASPAAGWYLWLLCSLAAIGVSIWLLVKGTRPAPAPQPPYSAPQQFNQPPRAW